MSRATVEKSATGAHTIKYPSSGSTATHVEQTVQQLREKLEAYRRRRARQTGWSRRFIPTGLEALDAMLPKGGLPCGAITEILCDDPGVGSLSLALRIANRCGGGMHGASNQSPAPDNRSIIFVDTLGDFYPPAAAQHGMALKSLVVIRTRRKEDAFWAVEQSLRCAAVATVIAPLASIDEHRSRQLQLAASDSGCVGLILRPGSQSVKSFAAVRMLLEGVSPDHDEPLCLSKLSARDACFCRVTLLKVLEGMPQPSILLDLQHETGTGPVHTLPVDRSIGKTG